MFKEGIIKSKHVKTASRQQENGPGMDLCGVTQSSSLLMSHLGCYYEDLSAENLWVESPADGVAAGATLDSELFDWHFGNWQDT